MGKILLHEESEANVSDSFLKDVSNRGQKWNVGPEHRKECETFRGCFGKCTPFLRLRARLKTGCEGEWSAFDPLPKLTQASDKDVRIIVGKERESYEPELN